MLQIVTGVLRNGINLFLAKDNYRKELAVKNTRLSILFHDYHEHEAKEKPLTRKIVLKSMAGLVKFKTEAVSVSESTSVF